MMNEQLKNEELRIESVDPYEEALGDWIDRGFDAFAEKHGVVCNYTPFAFAAKRNGKVVGVIKGHSFYREVHIGELIVEEAYRGQRIGTKLLTAAEANFQGKGFDNISLTTYRFQAPEFYRKNGYTLEFIRENPACPALSKYFFIKKLDQEKTDPGAREESSCRSGARRGCIFIISSATRRKRLFGSTAI